MTVATVEIIFLCWSISCVVTRCSICVPQDEVDSQNPLFRDNPQLHEEVKSWLKDQKVQEIFMQGKHLCIVVFFREALCLQMAAQRSALPCDCWNCCGGRKVVHFMNSTCVLPPPGPYSLNGYRVRVYRQDSATQWFTGIITHHDLFSRNMVVMNDQVPAPAVCVTHTEC